MTWWHLSFSNIFFYSEHGVSGSVSGRQWLTVKPCIRACLFAVTAHMVLGFWSWWLPSLWQIFGFFSLADRNNQILLHLTSVLHINQVSPGQQAIPVIKTKQKQRGGSEDGWRGAPSQACVTHSRDNQELLLPNYSLFSLCRSRAKGEGRLPLNTSEELRWTLRLCSLCASPELSLQTQRLLLSTKMWT